MLNLKSSPPFAVGLTLVAMAAFAQTGAPVTATVSVQLPPMGLAASETAQVNIVNTALPPSGGGLQPYCNATIVFYGGIDGQSILGNIAAFNVQTGQIFSVTLPYALANTSGSRTVFRVAVTLSPFLLPTASGPQVAPCTLMASLETYDSATGVTHAFASASAALDPPAAASRQASSMPGGAAPASFPKHAVVAEADRLADVQQPLRPPSAPSRIR